MINKFFFNEKVKAILSSIVIFGILIFSMLFHSKEPIQNLVTQISPETETLIGTAATNTLALDTSTPTPTQQNQINLSQIPEDPFIDIMDITLAQIERQNEVDQYLLTELKSGSYSMQKPLIVVNPYNISPLSCLILFTSDKPQNISIHIEGLDTISDVDFSFKGYNRDHIIPIYGLYPDKENQVTIKSKSENGEIQQVILEVSTEPLPKELNEVIFLTELSNKELYQPGFNFGYNGQFKTAIDAYGSYRWLLVNHFLPYALIDDNQLIVALGEVLQGNVLFFEINPLGRISKIFYAPFGIHHDVTKYNGNLLVTGSSGDTIEDFIYEIDNTSGEIKNTLDLKTVLQRSRKTSLAQGGADWFHQNAVTWNGSDSEIIISGRNQSSIVKLSWPEGKINWILASHDGWLPMFEKYLLTPIGENFEWPYGQHAPEILPDQDDNPDTIDIMLFDNGNNRFDFEKELQRKIRNNEIIAPELFSRMVQYRINEKNKTVEQIWQFGKDYGEEFFSVRAGDANLLPNGNRLGVFDIETEINPNSPRNGTFFEVNEQSNIIWFAQTVSKKEYDKQSEYRLTRMEIYNQSANDLQIGTPVINLIPEEILEQYGFQQ